MGPGWKGVRGRASKVRLKVLKSSEDSVLQTNRQGHDDPLSGFGAMLSVFIFHFFSITVYCWVV